MAARYIDHCRGAASHLLCRALALALSASLVAATVLAVVTITGFVVEPGESEIYVNWETASEIDNLGFYVWRSQAETTGYAKLPLDSPPEQFIPSQDDFGVGALYEFVDVQVTPGIRYYYKVEDVPSSGGSTIVGPLSAMIPLPTTATLTPSPTPSPTPLPDGPTPTPDVSFWADPAQVSAGSCSTVLWRTQNVQAVYFDGAGVPGEGARAFCPCAEEMHVLRVQYRDGRAEDFTVTIRVTGVCGPATGSSPLATPRLPATPTALPTPSAVEPPAPLPAAEVPAPTTPSPRGEATVAPAVTQVSPVNSPTVDATALGVLGGTLRAPVASATPLVSPTRASGALLGEGIVQTKAVSRYSALWMGLALVLAFGAALVVGGLLLWKRSL
jgi:hypothetical protein